MSDQKKQTEPTDVQLDRLLALYDVPALDGEAFNRRVMSRIGEDGPARDNDSRIIVWSRARKAVAFSMVALLFAAFLFSQTGGETGSEQSQPVQVAAVAENDDLADIDAFLNEIIDQDIAVLEYSVAMNTRQSPNGAEEPAQEDSAPDLPPIDEFLDELLGLESRVL